MTVSKREERVAAVVAMIETALPDATVERNLETPEEIPPGGLVVVWDGDPGEPDVTLSPVCYGYSHRILVEVGALAQPPLTRETVLDRMLGAIGAGIEADHHLGGLVEYLEAEAPVIEAAQALGTQTLATAEFAIVAHYSVGNPLT